MMMNMKQKAVTRPVHRRSAEAGFTLVEAMMAIVILVFGLVAVTNLLVVAGNSSIVANAGTTAAAIAAEQMETLKAQSFLALVPGGSLTANQAGFFRDVATDDQGVNHLGQPRLRVPGGGTINVRWTITQVPGHGQLLYIVVRAEAQGTLLGQRTRAEYTSLRACTDPIPTGGACPVNAVPCCPGPP